MGVVGKAWGTIVVCIRGAVVDGQNSLQGLLPAIARRASSAAGAVPRLPEAAAHPGQAGRIVGGRAIIINCEAAVWRGWVDGRRSASYGR